MKDIRETVREKYGQIARTDSSCCAPASNCCGHISGTESVSERLGYSKEDLEKIPKDSDLGLGCGNPAAFAALNAGETVLDLGSGGGIDCFIAAKMVGSTGSVIGVDMTADMITRARKNAEQGGYSNVEFRLGEIEHLPLADSAVDVIISNCVINLSPDKDQVFREAFRTLKSGGRMLVSDIVLTQPLPEKIAADINAYAGCISGALLKNDYIKSIENAGFTGVKIVTENSFFTVEDPNDPFVRDISSKFNLTREEVAATAATVLSIKVEAKK